MVKKITYLLCIILSVSSCKNNKYVDVYEIGKSYDTPVLASNYSQCMKSDGEGLCYLSNRNNKYFLTYLDLDFKNPITFEIPMGKGPGEIQVSGGISIYNDIFYILDLISRKLEVYSKDGDHIDTFYINITDNILSFDLIDEHRIVIKTENTKDLIVYDLVEKKILNSVKQNQLGNVYCNDGNIYHITISTPFIFSQFDTELSRMNEKKIKTDKNISDLKLLNDNGRSILIGDFLGYSAYFDGRDIYTPTVAKRIYNENSSFVRKPYQPEIVILNKKLKAKKYVHIQGINTINGYVTVVFGSNSDIILHVIDYGGDIAKYFNKEYFKGFLYISVSEQ